MGNFKLSDLSKNNDIILAIVLVVIIGMMIIPLPPFLIDILLTINISLAIIILLVCLYTTEPLQYSSFPTILLMATLFRLGLNVSATRLILLHGSAGEVITAFGQFVVGGNYVVGVVIFIILVVINFMVITNGAGRVAEVAARFTLDAMPGKQLSVDADLNSGIITEEEAKQKRKDFQREADFYGTMDGASKFVKGDATAGIFITVVNIVGGFIIGIVQNHLSFVQSAATYTILTVGDGLVSQLPALIISTATGLIVTRAGGKETGLSKDIENEMFGNPKVLGVVSGLLLLLGFVPGLPKMPFFLIGGFLGVLSFWKLKDINKEKEDEIKAKDLETSQSKKTKKKASKESVMELLNIEPIEIEIGYRLVPLLDIEQGGDLLERIAQIRRQTAIDLGIILPSIRVRDNLQLPANNYQIKLRGIPIETGEVYSDRHLAMNAGAGDDDPNLKGITAVEPAFGLPALWIAEKDKEYAESEGYTVVSASAVISTHITEVIKKNSSEILTRPDVQTLIENLKKQSEAFVEDVFKDNNITTSEVHMVLQNLLREKVPIKDLQTILETLSTYQRINKNPDFLTEQCRMALSRSICKQNLSDSGELLAITISPEIENTIATGISNDGQSLSLEPNFTRKLISSLNLEIETALKSTGNQPVILCSSPIRMAFRRLIERTFPQISVMSYNEVPGNISARSVGMVKV
ncbi:MAG: flagellar biosynthesis protein FlhA [bacterium]